MKTALKAVGLIVFPFILFGSLFKIQHWPGASIMLILGVTGFALAFLPMFMVHEVKRAKSSLAKAAVITLSVSLIFISLGLLFKVQHYPGGSLFLILGTLLIVGSAALILISSFQDTEYSAPGPLLFWFLAVVAGMLLVFSVNVSKEVLTAFTKNEVRLNLSNIVLLLTLDERAELLGEKGKNIHIQSMLAYDLIERSKARLVETAEGSSAGDFKSEENISEHIMNKDNMEVGTYVLGVDYDFGIYDELSADSILSKLEIHRDFLFNQLPQGSRTSAFVESLFNYPNMMNYGRETTWSRGMFYHSPLISSVFTLTSLQNDVLQAESLVLMELSKGVTEVTMDESSTEP